jgi:RNA polymerase sigma factor (sigma-70 family)
MLGQLKMRTKQERYEEQILKQYDKLINKLASEIYKNYNQKYPLEDLLVEAKLGAIKGLRCFDPSKNVKLITHLHNYIKFNISHYIRANSGLIKVPKNPAHKIIPEIVDNEFLLSNSNYSSDASKTINDSDNKILVEKYLDILPEKQKKVLQLIYVEGFTYNEVAKKMNVSRQFANSIAIKAINKIKEEFTKDFI